MPTIEPGQVFFDKLEDGRYEKCILQKTDESTPDRHSAARGGTGEYYKRIPKENLTAEKIDNADEMLYDLELGRFVFLEKDA